jgi:transcription initiation factor TFIIA large subunit
MEIASVYHNVIKDVVLGVKDDFVAEQLDESILREVALLWEKKVFESDAFKINVGESEPLKNVQGSVGASMKEAERECTGRNKEGEVEKGSGEEEDEEEEKEGEEDKRKGETEECEPRTANVVLSQFEKVSRSKSKWKCALKEGIMYLNGKEYFFGKGIGEFQW